MTRIVYYRCLLLFLLFFLWNINQSYGKNAVDLTKIAKELKDSKNTQSLKKTEKTAELILKNIDNIADENILNQTAEIFIKLNRFQDAEKLLKYSLSLNPLNKKTVK
ncbi:MAG TPA: hypothetical protein PLJ38_05960, partial [bacterium]|nr:hypothetical protein [bacterium]